MDAAIDLDAFREQIRGFFGQEYPLELLDKYRRGVVFAKEDHVRNQKALRAKGWLAGAWPVEYGGAGWSPARQQVFDEEAARAGMPYLIPTAITYLGPIIYTFGSDDQKRLWLPDILESRTIWAQGYSEPEAGSDLASLGMSAVLQGEEYLLNGEKVWTSYAQYADWIFCLVRTSRGERRQQGITFLCVDMSSPGVRIHPIITIDGLRRLNRVEFDNVRVPVANRIGDEGDGWRYATVLLHGERLSFSEIGRKQDDLRRMRELAARTPTGSGGVMLDLPGFASRLASCEIALEVLKISLARVVELGDAASPAPISALKIEGTLLGQQISELGVELNGSATIAFPDRVDPDWPTSMPLVPPEAPLAMGAYIFERAMTILGGATEIQKNIIWRHLAG